MKLNFFILGWHKEGIAEAFVLLLQLDDSPLPSIIEFNFILKSFEE